MKDPEPVHDGQGEVDDKEDEEVVPQQPKHTSLPLEHQVPEAPHPIKCGDH